MRKVLFLDIDGVLNPKWWVRKAFVDSYGYAFDTECIANLKRIIDDMDDILPEQQAYFIQTDPEIGISDIDVMKAKLLFQKQENENHKR